MPPPPLSVGPSPFVPLPGPLNVSPWVRSVECGRVAAQLARGGWWS